LFCCFDSTAHGKNGQVFFFFFFYSNIPNDSTVHGADDDSSDAGSDSEAGGVRVAAALERTRKRCGEINPPFFYCFFFLSIFSF
jgi:hypothetical protein